jgi:hypothetical protein
MAASLNAAEIIDREFLEIRAKILELAASFDRLDRADGSVDGDPRMSLLAEALQVISGDQRERAEQVQLLFSRQYEDDWREQFGVGSVR